MVPALSHERYVHKRGPYYTTVGEDDFAPVGKCDQLQGILGEGYSRNEVHDCGAGSGKDGLPFNAIKTSITNLLKNTCRQSFHCLLPITMQALSAEGRKYFILPFRSMTGHKAVWDLFPITAQSCVR